MKIIEDVVYGEFENNLLDIYLAEKENAPVFLYFHGGGLEKGSYKKHREFMEKLAEKGVNVVSAEYRMYPTAKYPEFILDAANAVLWIKNNLSKYTTYSELYVGGSSAGGYLSQMLCFDHKYLAQVGVDQSFISGYIHDAGQPTTHFNVLRERGYSEEHGGTKYRNVIDEAGPIYHIDGDHTYRPMMFLLSDHDMPNRYEQTMLMLSAMKNYGCDMDNVKLVVMENTTHCSYVKKFDEKGESRFVNEICKFINNN